MAEPEIRADIASSAEEMSGLPGARAHGRPRLAVRTLGLMVQDALVIAVTAVGCFLSLAGASAALSWPTAIPVGLLIASVMLCFLERGLYAPAQVAGQEPHWRRLGMAWLQGVSVATLLTFCIGTTAAYHGMDRQLSVMMTDLRGFTVPVLLVVGLVTLSGARMLRLRFPGAAASLNRTIIIGDEMSARDLLARIRTGVRRDFDVIGLVDHDAAAEPRSDLLGLPLFTGIEALEQLIRRDAVDTVLVALPWSAGEHATKIVRRISMAPVDVYVYPGMNELDIPLRRANAAYDLPLLMACNRPIGGWGAFMKRTEDIVLSVGLLAFIAPVMLTVALLIKLTSRGPVFFRQRRLGYNNRVIEVLKFRSMYTHLADADASVQALRGDKRVTPVGGWLRKTSLDELPQLLNVLKGDMSLVGPRPHALATTAGGLALEEAVPTYSSRHRVKPGITGWAQVNGYRGALDNVEKIVQRVNHDLYYIENWSLGLDLKILCRTVRLVFADDNAF